MEYKVAVAIVELEVKVTFLWFFFFNKSMFITFIVDARLYLGSIHCQMIYLYFVEWIYFPNMYNYFVHDLLMFIILLSCLLIFIYNFFFSRSFYFIQYHVKKDRCFSIANS